MAHHWVTCFRCKTEFAMADDVWTVCHQRAGVASFWCPNGHEQVFAIGETEAEKLRHERDKLKQNAAYLHDEIARLRQDRDHEKRRVIAAKGQITKLKNRASKGVCPCCNRHFTDLERHMSSKHPGFINEPDATEVRPN